jgi:hypothetical protein
VCRGCGAYTQPRNGKGDAYGYCKTCHPGATQPKWTREVVLVAMLEWMNQYGCLPSSYDWSRTHAKRRGGVALSRLSEDQWPPASVVSKLFGSWRAARQEGTRLAGSGARSSSRILRGSRVPALYLSGVANSTDRDPQPRRPATLERIDPATAEPAEAHWMSAAFIDAIARRVVELTTGGRTTASPAEPALLTVAEVAARLNVSQAWVYAHKRDLGAMRLGTGPRAAAIRCHRGAGGAEPTG